MPFYDYQCPHCKYQQVEFMGINDVKEVKCKQCRKETTRKMSQTAPPILKGDGFYKPTRL